MLANGHRYFGEDLGDKPRLCCKRLPNRSWCVLEDGHTGRCLGYETEPPPPKPPAHWICQCSSCTAARKQ